MINDKSLARYFIIVLIFIASCQENSKEESFSIFLDKFKTNSVFQDKRIEARIGIYQIPESDTNVIPKLSFRIKKEDLGFIDLRNDSIYSNKVFVDKDQGFIIKIIKKKDSVIYKQQGIGDNLLNYNYIFKKRSYKWYLTDIYELTP